MTVQMPLTEEQNQLLENADIACIGPGPAGLHTAIQAALRARDRGEKPKIVFLDKHAYHMRNHPLKITPSVFKKDLHPQTNIKGFSDKVHKFYIRTRDLEHMLVNRAMELGIHIIRSPEIQENLERRLRQTCPKAREEAEKEYLNEVFSRAKKARTIIGSAGAHGLVRKHVFQDKLSDDSTEKYVAQVKFKVKGPAKAMSAVRWAYPTAKILDFKALEFVGKPDEQGETTVSVRFFLDKKTFNALRATKDAEGNIRTTPRNPIRGETMYDLTSKEVPARLAKSVRTWLNAKKRQLAASSQKLSIIEGTLEMTTIPLRYFKSKECVKFGKIGNREVEIFIVGDEYKVSPYFTSLNYGLKTGAMAAAALAESDPKKRRFAFKQYAKKTNRALFWLKLHIKLRSFFLTLASWFIFLSAYTPWQVHRWSTRQTRQLLAEDPMLVPQKNITLYPIDSALALDIFAEATGGFHPFYSSSKCSQKVPPPMPLGPEHSEALRSTHPF